MLDVIGAGYGRTGTLSTKFALERLGFGPCYHAVESLRHPGHLPKREAAFDGSPDWTDLFDGYRSTMDWPGMFFWRELLDACPDAKVILTVRDPRRWFASIRGVGGSHGALIPRLLAQR
ncbi:sulfotransferase family protein [Actinomadura sp. 9N215]|uniref:sulfotransferase family protein n=1 Tax=Actinomadura sp. 9N215 TaxID=3375150 RepID=UPI003790E35C